ncbi:hypothetical protein [Pseudomonas sp.]|uniref:hypothetical protein n=1 Tax=Pseudomonas sp. TaxID=306 RepID=UPI00272EF9EC|nr:hypothetical protein [Pseudomonas sp.]MDP2446580.1 hypothetical protein [Pseudomonas sp.]MDZ4334266.1 hypothetical protein [Pseudomonas sp.]
MALRKPLVRISGKVRQLPAADVLGLDLWAHIPIGSPFPLWTHLTGVTAPPTDNANYRYIKLTASDSYNTGVLSSESLSGSAPLVQATAAISDTGSALNGQTVRLINTERRALRAGSSGTVEADALQNITGSFSGSDLVAIALNSTGLTGAFAAGGSLSSRPSFTATAGVAGTFDASRVARTASETRAKNIGADYYMRIR